MNGQGDTAAATLADIVETVRSHPGLTGKATYPPFPRTDPCSAGMAAAIANVSDAAAMGGRPLGGLGLG